MTNRFQLAVIAAGMMMAGSAAQAQQNVCQANVAQVLSELVQIVRHEHIFVMGGDAAVRLRQHHFDEVERRAEERPRAVHRVELVTAAVVQRIRQRFADAEP